MFASLAIVATLAIAFVQAEPTPTYVRARGGYGNQSPGKSCKSNEFYFPDLSCCLPHGGPSKSPPSPPPQTQCPSTHYWGSNQGCCVPYHPNPPPVPTCPPQYGWDSSRKCCTPSKPPSKPPTNPPPKPSGKPSYPGGDKDNNGHGKGNGGGYNNGGGHNGGGYGGGHWKAKRNSLQWDATICPKGLTTCPIFANGLATGDSECVDTYSDLTSCGGCASLNTGKDCSKIPYATLASCHGGECVVEECSSGYSVSDDETSCVAH